MEPEVLESPSPGSRSLDFAILRQRDLGAQARLGFDPRKSPETIAAELRVSPATIRRRLADWRDRGFFVGYNVLPHPALLGGRLFARVLEFRDAVSQSKAIGTLGLIDGVIEIDPSRDRLFVAFFADSASQAGRRLSQFRAIEGIKDVGPEMLFDFAPCSRRMSSSDWSFVRAVRRRPEARFTDLAKEVGQSVKTVSRKFDSLFDQGALMFDPILDFSRFPQTLAGLNAYFDGTQTSEELERRVRELHPESMRSWGPTFPPGTQIGGQVNMLLTAPAAAELDNLITKIAELPGVVQASLWYARYTMPVHDWLDDRLERMLADGRLAASTS